MFSHSLVAAFALWSHVASAAATLEPRSNATNVCLQIGQAISSSSSMVYPLDLLTYESDISHWFLTSTQSPACVLQTGSTEDVSAAMKIIGSTRTPFAVYSGGHSSNPGFSSTTGVHISFQKMEQVVVSSDQKTITIGMGQTWAGVYQALDGSGVNVVGGRTVGPGVGGFTLGGGYSWLTNQYGLTCDNVKSYTIVLPNGTISQVDSSNKDLYWALKGGLNRFGVVTAVEYYAVLQVPTIYGGIKLYDPQYTQQLLNATNNFQKNNKDPKIQIITTLSGSATGTSALILYFSDGPTPPAAFAEFDAVPSLLNTVKSQSFSSFVSSIPSHAVLNARGTFNSLSTTTLTPGFLAAVKNVTDFYGAQMLTRSATMLSVDVEPFLLGWGKHATDSAYPHSLSPLPLNLYFAWTSPSDDAFWYDVMRQVVADLTVVAQKEGIYDPRNPTYPNYAISGTSAEALYGAANAKRLAKIRKAVDPANVMRLAGGFDI